MLTIQEMKDMLEKALPPKRFKHSLGVYETALKMAEHYGMPQEKVAVAALLHDCGREVPTDKQVEKAEELGMEVLFGFSFTHDFFLQSISLQVGERNARLIMCISESCPCGFSGDQCHPFCVSIFEQPIPYAEYLC